VSRLFPFIITPETTGNEMSTSDWNGMRVRKEEKYGTVIKDENYRLRILTVKMDDGTEETITMNNIGPDPNPEELHKWEWYWDKSDDKKWYRF
jgi:hypothetical protein